MKNRIKNGLICIFTFVLMLTLCLNVNVSRPKAADVSISIALSASSVSIGGGVTATISVNGGNLSAYTMYVAYNSGVLQFNSGSGAVINGGGGTVVVSGTSAGSVSLSFTAISNGSSGISTSGSDFLNLDGSALSVSHAGVNVTVATASNNNDSNSNDNKNDNNKNEEDSTTETTEEDDRSDNCKLASLQISPGTLEPAFSPDTTSYFVQVEKDVTSMVVSAATADSKATTQVWGAGLIEPGENTVKITVTAENGAVKVYNLRVMAGEDPGDANVTIDDEFYKFANNENVDGIPDGFTSETIEYKDWEVLAFKSPNKAITVVCLVDVEENYKWFIYNAEKDEFTPYNEFSSKYNRYIILDFPEDVKLDESFEKTEIIIDKVKVTAYKSPVLNDNDLYVIYAMNIEGGEALYVYDKAEGTFMRYVPELHEEEEIISTATDADAATVTDANVTKAPIPQKKNGKILAGLIAAIVAALIFLIMFLVMLTKNKAYKLKAQEAEDMVESLGGGRGIDRTLLNNADDNVITENRKADLKKATTETNGNVEIPQISDITELKVEDISAETMSHVETKRKKNSTSFVDAVNSMEPINLDKQKDEFESFEAGYKPDDKEIQFEEFEHNSSLINSKIKEDYDAGKDSAFDENDK